MTPRALWFAVGSAAGAYATVKARRAAYRLSVPGLVDQAAALGLGWRAFSSEVRDGMQARERDLLGDLYRRAAPPGEDVPPALTQLDADDDKDRT